jgi:hypothetical protein
LFFEQAATGLGSVVFSAGLKFSCFSCAVSLQLAFSSFLVFVVLPERTSTCNKLGTWCFDSLCGDFDFVDFVFPIDCGWMQVEAGLLLSYRIKKLEVF